MSEISSWEDIENDRELKNLYLSNKNLFLYEYLMKYISISEFFKQLLDADFKKTDVVEPLLSVAQQLNKLGQGKAQERALFKLL